MIVKLFVIVVIAAILIAVYMGTDNSKEAIIRREQKKEETRKGVKSKLVDPISKSVESRVSQDKIKKAKSRYEHAGLRLSYTATLLIRLFCALALAGLSIFGLKNPFMGFVAFIAGWNLPVMIIDFFVNKRLGVLDEQIGMFMRMTTERFRVTNNFYQSLVTTVNDMAGEEPVYSELTRMVAEIESGFSISDAMHRLADRIGNKYMRRFADYYEITADIGTKEARESVLQQAITQYNHHIKTTRDLKKQLSELTMTAYIMLAFVPVVVVFQASQDETYIPFMTETMLGKVGSAVFVLIWMFCFWLINSKLGAPLEKDGE